MKLHHGGKPGRPERRPTFLVRDVTRLHRGRGGRPAARPLLPNETRKKKREHFRAESPALAGRFRFRDASRTLEQKFPQFNLARGTEGDRNFPGDDEGRVLSPARRAIRKAGRGRKALRQSFAIAAGRSFAFALYFIISLRTNQKKVKSHVLNTFSPGSKGEWLSLRSGPRSRGGPCFVAAPPGAAKRRGALPGAGPRSVKADPLAGRPA